MVIAALAISCAISIQAQNYDDERMNEISIGYGLPVNSSNSLDFLGDSFTGGLFKGENDKYIGPITAEYFYHINPLVGIGAIGVYSCHKKDHVNDDKVTAKIKNQYFTFMPAVKINWLRRENWGLYSKLGVGYSYGKYSLNDLEDPNSNQTDNTNSINWQASLIGAEIGSASVRAFAELGFGEQGLMLAGVRFRF